MSEAETKEIEAIRALVEFTWKQESIEKISGEIREHIEKITDEVKGRVEERAINEIAKGMEERITGEIKEQVGKITDEIRKEVEKRITANRKPSRLYLALVLSFASIGLGIGIAALAGLIS